MFTTLIVVLAVVALLALVFGIQDSLKARSDRSVNVRIPSKDLDLVDHYADRKEEVL